MNSVIVKKEDLKYNIEKIKEHTKINGKDDLGNDVKIIAVVKSNGYGLGIVELTNYLIDNGIDFFAVSSIEEAIKLRQAGIKHRILLLSSTSIESDIRTLVENNIIISIGSKEAAENAQKIGQELNTVIKAHIKIDTGFGRYGFLYNNPDEIVTTIKTLTNIKIEGTFSHFSNAYYDDNYTKIQFDRFINFIEIMRRNKIEPGMLHICNTSAFIKFPRMHLNAVRIGSGFTGRISFNNSIGLRKIGYLRSNVTEIKNLPKGFNIGYSNAYTTKRETKIAIIPMGYINGVNIEVGKDMFRIRDKLRYIYNDIKDFFKKQKIYVKIAEQNCAILGRIGTYHTVVDITNKNINIGDEAIFNVGLKYVDSGIKREWI